MTNIQALNELKALLNEFEEYTYYKNEKSILFQNLTQKQFAQLFMIIQKYRLKFKVDKGIKVIL